MRIIASGWWCALVRGSRGSVLSRRPIPSSDRRSSARIRRSSCPGCRCPCPRILAGRMSPTMAVIESQTTAISLRSSIATQLWSFQPESGYEIRISASFSWFRRFRSLECWSSWSSRPSISRFSGFQNGGFFEWHFRNLCRPKKRKIPLSSSEFSPFCPKRPRQIGKGFLPLLELCFESFLKIWSQTAVCQFQFPFQRFCWPGPWFTHLSLSVELQTLWQAFTFPVYSCRYSRWFVWWCVCSLWRLVWGIQLFKDLEGWVSLLCKYKGWSYKTFEWEK